jgi:7-cyano-7-deazaguanine synthase
MERSTGSGDVIVPVRRAVVLLSGGLDSATTLAMARADGMECFALTVRYGQRHAHEVDCAVRVAEALGAARHQVLDLDLAAFGGSSLLGEGEIPRSPQPGVIPSTYVPARNTIFLSLALGWAEVLGAEAIYLGVNAIDYSGYPDCRPEYLDAFVRLASLATRRGVEGNPIEVRAPLVRMSKGDIVARGRSLGVDFSLTSSCYDPGPGGTPCGSCDSCRLRAQGFKDAGIDDPLYPAG